MRCVLYSIKKFSILTVLQVKLADFGSAIILANASEFPVVGGSEYTCSSSSSSSSGIFDDSDILCSTAPAFMPPEVYSIHMGGDKFQGSIEYEKVR